MEEIYLSDFLRPYLNMAQIYGLDASPANSWQDRKSLSFQDKLKTIYIQSVELILWGQFVLNLSHVIPGFSENSLCIGWDQQDTNPIMKVVFAGFTFLIASIFSCLKRAKIDLEIRLNSLKYIEEKKLQKIYIINRYLSLTASLTFVFVGICYQTIIFFSLYPDLKETEKFYGEALFCCVEVGLMTNYFIGIYCNILLIGAICVWFVCKEYDMLLQDMSLIRKNDLYFEFKLKELMISHQELWTFVEQFNNRIKYPFVLIYVIITYCTSLCYYLLLYIDMIEELRYITLLLCIACTFICITYALLLCCFSFNMLNGFQDIRQFAECDLRLKDKLKILNFMKRFGKVSLSLSVGGFFYVNKKFPIKIISTLHSVFSGLLKLRNVSGQKRNCEEIFTVNRTDLF